MNKPAPRPENKPQMIDGISKLADIYDHFILDIFGVVHDGLRPFPGTVEALGMLKKAGKQTCLLSNSPRRAEGAIAQMEAMGIARDLYDHVVTSGEATHHALKSRDDDFHRACGQDCWFIGTPVMTEVLEGIDLNLVDGPENASFILNAIPGTAPSAVRQLLERFKTACAMNLPMICANPDLVVNIGEEQFECAGTFAGIYEDMGGRVLYHGKPHAPVYERCHALLGRPDKKSVIALGDSLHTDIAGANNFGIDSAFNLVGIHWEEVRLDHAPAEADLDKVRTIVEKQPHRPQFAMAGFRW